MITKKNGRYPQPQTFVIMLDAALGSCLGGR